MASAAGASFPDGPPIRHSGGFGEPTCRACHSDGDVLGAPDAQLDIRGLPAALQPGRNYELEVVLRRPGLVRGGFQLAARFASGESLAALQAGGLAGSGDRVALRRDSVTGVWYAQHTRAGTAAVRPGELTWTVRWTAPRENQAVVFHLAAVAANDDNSNLGDEVYARAQVVRAARP